MKSAWVNNYTLLIFGLILGAISAYIGERFVEEMVYFGPDEMFQIMDIMLYVASVIVGYFFFKKRWWLFPLVLYIGSIAYTAISLGVNIIVLLIFVNGITVLIPSFIASLIGAKLGLFRRKKRN